MRERMEAVHNDARCDGGGRFYRAHSKPDASRAGERCHVILRAHMNEPRDSCGPSTYGDDASQHLLAMAPRAKFGVRLKQGDMELATVFSEERSAFSPANWLTKCEILSPLSMKSLLLSRLSR